MSLLFPEACPRIRRLIHGEEGESAGKFHLTLGIKHLLQVVYFCHAEVRTPAHR
jgi:hypothetical protein